MAIDFAAGMLGVLEQKARSQGLRNVEARVMDGLALDFPEASFDVVGSNFGVVFFSDVIRGLREMRRVLRPGGRAFVSTVGNQAESALWQLIVESLVRAEPSLKQLAPPNAPIPLGNGEALCEALERAGFERVRLATSTVSWEIRDPADFWQRWALSAPPVADALRELPRAVKSRAGEHFLRAIDAAFPDGEVAFLTEVLTAIGDR